MQPRAALARTARSCSSIVAVRNPPHATLLGRSPCESFDAITSVEMFVIIGGASSVYSADAVGVVIAMLRDDFKLLDIDAQTSITEAGDGAGNAPSTAHRQELRRQLRTACSSGSKSRAVTRALRRNPQFSPSAAGPILACGRLQTSCQEQASRGH